MTLADLIGAGTQRSGHLGGSNPFPAGKILGSLFQAMDFYTDEDVFPVLSAHTSLGRIRGPQAPGNLAIQCGCQQKTLP